MAALYLFEVNMKLCLGLLIQNSEHWLNCHLNKILESTAIDGLVAVDGGSTDHSADVIKTHGGYVYDRQFDWNFAAQSNHLMYTATSLGFEALLRLDPDELMYPAHIGYIKEQLDEYDVVRLPRYNFWMDRLHWTSDSYPDWQARLFRLGSNIHWQGRVHEQLYIPTYMNVLLSSETPIFHYGDIAVRPLTHYNYARLMNGLPPVDALPPDAPDEYRNPKRQSVLFEKKQPINPFDIGIHAPFSE